MGHFGSFERIKKYAETTLVMDKKIISHSPTKFIKE